MRGRLVLILAALAASTGTAQGQDIAPLALDSLITPASPALTLLGASPVAIERPSTPKAVALALASAIRDDQGLPKDLAVEFAPYWLTAHPRLTFSDYYEAGLSQRLLQTLGLSLGTSRLDPLDDGATAGTAVALGFRTTPVSGKPNPELVKAADSLSRIQIVFTREAMDLESDEEIQALWAAKYEAAARGAALRMQTLDNERIGFLMDLAGAMAFDFPADVADSGFVSRASVWVAPAYRPRDGAVEVLALARYVLDRRTGDDLHQFDFGARSIINIGALAGSLEFVEHAGDELPNGEAPSYRLAANLEYRVGASSAVSFTFGRDDRPEDGTTAGLIARLTLNLGFGQVPLLQIGSTP
jgi:hypothetical protein